MHHTPQRICICFYFRVERLLLQDLMKCVPFIFLSSSTTGLPPYSIEDFDVNILEQRDPCCRISQNAFLSSLYEQQHYQLDALPIPFLIYIPYVVIFSSFCVTYVISDIVTDRSTGYIVYLVSYIIFWAHLKTLTSHLHLSLTHTRK